MQKNVPVEHQGEFGSGDVWTWTALESGSKLIVSYLVGLRDSGYATEFIRDVASRLANRVQLSTDGHKAYLEAVEDALGGDIRLCPACEAVRDGHGEVYPPHRRTLKEDSESHARQIRAIVGVEVPTSCKGKKICHLNHTSMRGVGKVWNIHNVAEIAVLRPMLFKIRHEFTNARLTSRLVHDQEAFVLVTLVELANQERMESLTNIFQTIS